MRTIHELSPLPSSSSCMFLEWWRNLKPLPHHDSHQHYSVFYDNPSSILHPFVQGVLMSKSHPLQCATFQLMTHHAFHANHSSIFHPLARDNITCPHCDAPWTMLHILFECNEFWKLRGMILNPIAPPTIHQLFSSYNGGQHLVEFLHATQALLHPLPACPTDPP
jgi:hypothetical protein